MKTKTYKSKNVPCHFLSLRMLLPRKLNFLISLPSLNLPHVPQVPFDGLWKGQHKQYKKYENCPLKSLISWHFFTKFPKRKYGKPNNVFAYENKNSGSRN